MKTYRCLKCNNEIHFRNKDHKWHHNVPGQKHWATVTFNLTKPTKEYKNMGFERHNFNTTTQYLCSWTGYITRRKNAIYLRNKYQTELDNAYYAVSDMVHYLEEQQTELNSSRNYAEASKNLVDAKKEERMKLYDDIKSSVVQDMEHERIMWNETVKNQQINNVKNKTHIKDSDVDEINYNSMLRQISKYPDYFSKSIRENTETKEKELRQQIQQYHEAISKYNFLLSEFKIWIKKSEDKIAMYKKLYHEGTESISNIGYSKSIFYKFISEESKDKVNIITLNHRIPQFENTLILIKTKFITELNLNKQFVEMKY